MERPTKVGREPIPLLHVFFSGLGYLYTAALPGFLIPLPYPGVYVRSSGRRTSNRRQALQHATNLVVAVLSWESSGEPDSCPKWLGLGQPLTREQRGVVRLGGRGLVKQPFIAF